MAKKIIKFAAIGECMVEFRRRTSATFSIGLGGDTFNTAVYLARYRKQLNLSVDYISALSTDPFSKMILMEWNKEGINHRFTPIIPNKLPGLYFVETNQQGERKFYYYRSQSAARELFYAKSVSSIKKQLSGFDYLYFSGISLAILDNYSQQQLFSLLKAARQKGTVIVFDTNYRPSLWPNKKIAQKKMLQALKLSDIALLTFEDEKLLFNDKNPQSTLKRLRTCGIKESAIKMGEKGCLIFSNLTGARYLPAKSVKKIIDTTAAGDSFNAGYIAGKIAGLSMKEAAEWGMLLASKVIQFRGAIIPKSAMPKFSYQNE